MRTLVNGLILRSSSTTVPSTIDVPRAVFARRVDAWFAEDIDAYIGVPARRHADRHAVGARSKAPRATASSWPGLRLGRAHAVRRASPRRRGRGRHRVRRLDDWAPASGRRRDRRWHGLSVCELRDGRIAWSREHHLAPRAPTETAPSGLTRTRPCSGTGLIAERRVRSAGLERSRFGVDLARNLSTASLNAFGVSAIRPVAAPREHVEARRRGSARPAPQHRRSGVSVSCDPVVTSVGAVTSWSWMRMSSGIAGSRRPAPRTPAASSAPGRVRARSRTRRSSALEPRADEPAHAVVGHGPPFRPRSRSRPTRQSSRRTGDPGTRCTPARATRHGHRESRRGSRAMTPPIDAPTTCRRARRPPRRGPRPVLRHPHEVGTDRAARRSHRSRDCRSRCTGGFRPNAHAAAPHAAALHPEALDHQHRRAVAVPQMSYTMRTPSVVISSLLAPRRWLELRSARADPAPRRGTASPNRAAAERIIGVVRVGNVAEADRTTLPRPERGAERTAGRHRHGNDRCAGHRLEQRTRRKFPRPSQPGGRQQNRDELPPRQAARA